MRSLGKYISLSGDHELGSIGFASRSLYEITCPCIGLNVIIS